MRGGEEKKKQCETFITKSAAPNQRFFFFFFLSIYLRKAHCDVIYRDVDLIPIYCPALFQSHRVKQVLEKEPEVLQRQTEHIPKQEFWEKPDDDELHCVGSTEVRSPV